MCRGREPSARLLRASRGREPPHSCESTTTRSPAVWVGGKPRSAPPGFLAAHALSDTRRHCASAGACVGGRVGPRRSVGAIGCSGRERSRPSEKRRVRCVLGCIRRPPRCAAVTHNARAHALASGIKRSTALEHLRASFLVAALSLQNCTVGSQFSTTPRQPHASCACQLGRRCVKQNSILCNTGPSGLGHVSNNISVAGSLRNLGQHGF